MLHPQIYQRDCQHCLKYEYNEQTGEAVTFHGKPISRHHKNPPLCKTPKGCPKGEPNKLKILSEKNMRAYTHYLECRAVGQFPNDPIVRSNARMIRQVEDRANEQKRIDELSLILGIRQ